MINKKREKANSFIESYFSDTVENETTFRKAILDFQKCKQSFKPYEYLFDYEIAKIFHYHLHDLESGEKYYNEALKSILDDNTIEGEIYFCLGNLYKENKLSITSNENYFKCIDIYEKLSDIKYLEYKEICYRHIAANFEDEEDYDKAIEYYFKADKISKKTKYSGIAQFLLGSLYSNKLDDVDKALEHAEKAMNVLKEDIYIIGNHRLISHIHLKLKNYEQAILYCNKIIEKYPESEFISDFYTILGKVYCNDNNEEKGIQFFNLALKSIRDDEPDFKEKYIHLRSWIALAEEGKNNLEQALKISSSVIEEFEKLDENLIFTISIKGRVLLKLNHYLDGYEFLKRKLWNYETSKYFNENDLDYIEALDLKNEHYKKLPILNRFFEKLKSIKLN